MSRVDTSTAVRDAIDTSIEVIRNDLEPVLTSINDESELPLPAPDDEAIFFTWAQPDQDIFAHNTICYLNQESARTQDSSSSGGNGRFTETRSFNLATIIIFKTVPYEDITRHGKKLTKEEILQLRAVNYAGALDEAMRKNAPDGSTIHDCELLDDSANTLYINAEDQESGLVGVGGCKFKLTQVTSAPSPAL